MLIALGVSGGIAAYKACEIVRGLDKSGAEVQVILTESATNFITPLTLQTLSRRKVFIGAFDLDEEQTVRHIELTRRVAALVVAPATANVLAKFARGIADDFLSTYYISVTAPVVVAPAMNTRMWLHPATQENVATLKRRGVQVVDPESGWLAEGETGWGRLAAPELIVAAALGAARRTRQLAGKKVVVTAGPTHEPLDPVRYISNRSSGKMGFALAEAAARRGAEVCLIAGPVERPVPFGVQHIGVSSHAYASHQHGEQKNRQHQIKRTVPFERCRYTAGAMRQHLPGHGCVAKGVQCIASVVVNLGCVGVTRRDDRHPQLLL